MKKILIILLLLAVSNQVYANDENYDLDNDGIITEQEQIIAIENEKFIENVQFSVEEEPLITGTSLAIGAGTALLGGAVIVVTGGTGLLASAFIMPGAAALAAWLTTTTGIVVPIVATSVPLDFVVGTTISASTIAIQNMGKSE
jgi:hypothetical protein